MSLHLIYIPSIFTVYKDIYFSVYAICIWVVGYVMFCSISIDKKNNEMPIKILYFNVLPRLKSIPDKYLVKYWLILFRNSTPTATGVTHVNINIMAHLFVLLFLAMSKEYLLISLCPWYCAVINDSGWRYVSEAPLHGCGPELVTAMYGVIRSPNYPKCYTPRVHCKWTLRVSGIKVCCIHLHP